MSAFAHLFELAQRDDPEALLAELPRDRTPSSIRDPKGATLVLHCAYRGLSHNLDALLERYPEISLHEAAAVGDADRVSRLLDRSRDALDTLSTDGWTPLHLAAFFGRDAVADLLLEYGADPTVYSLGFERNLPVHAASASPRASAELLRRIASVTPDLDLRQSSGHTALMLAAAGGRNEAVEVLLELGADPTVANALGKTAGRMASERGHPELAARLEAAAPPDRATS